MAVVVPIIASAMAASAATTAVGMFLTYSATALSVMGALSGDKDLTKMAGFMSMAGGVYGAMSGAATAGGEAAAAATDTASAASEAALPAATDFAPAVESAFPSIEAANAGLSVDAASGLENIGQQEGLLGNTFTQTPGGMEGGMAGGADAIGYGDALEQASSGMDRLFGPGESVIDQVGMIPDPVMQSAPTDGGMLQSWNPSTDLNDGLLGPSLTNTPPKVPPAQTSMLDKAESWLQNHKGLTNIALKGLSAMTDPRAKYLEEQQALLNRRRNNMSQSPIRLGIVR